MANSISVKDATGTPITVATNDAVISALPAKGTAGTPATDVVSVQGVVGGVAQPISAAALPLPTGAAQESGGNLATIAAAQGAQGTGLNPPTGGSGILGFLSGILNKLNNALTLGAGSAIIGKVGIDQTTPGTTNAVQAITGTTGGATQSHTQCAATTNATSLKGSAGQVYGIQLTNTSTTQTAYLKLYNKASSPTVGTDTPSKVICIPAAATTLQPTVVTISAPIGISFSTGIAFAITGGSADTDTTAITTAGSVICEIDYK